VRLTNESIVDISAQASYPEGSASRVLHVMMADPASVDRNYRFDEITQLIITYEAA